MAISIVDHDGDGNNRSVGAGLDSGTPLQGHQHHRTVVVTRDSVSIVGQYIYNARAVIGLKSDI